MTTAPGHNTQPAPEATGYSHPKCYARASADCSKQISREHYVSRGILEEMGTVPGVAGLSFQAPDTLQSIGVGALSSKMLCERHNSVLSPLDVEARNLFRTLRRFDVDLRNEVTSPVVETVTVNGTDLERWMLKVLLGLSAARVLSTTAVRDQSKLIEVLFGQAAWHPGWGLYLVASDDRPSYAFTGLEIATSIHDSVVWSADINLAGLPLLLAFGVPGGGSFGYRPAGLHLSRPPSLSPIKTLEFSWAHGPVAGYAPISRLPDYDGPRPQDRDLRPGS